MTRLFARRAVSDGGGEGPRGIWRCLAVLALLAAGCVTRPAPPGGTREDWLAAARQNEKEGRVRAAESLYRKASEQDAEPDARGTLGLADNLASRGMWKKALPLYERAHGLTGDNPHLLNNWAVCVLKSGGDPAQALDLARRACRWAPDNPYYLDTLAEALLALGEFEWAATTLEKASARAQAANAPPRVRRHLLEQLFRAWLEAGNETLAWQAATARDRQFPDDPWPADLRKKWRRLRNLHRPLSL